MRNRRGFTATELILGIVIMSITALAFAPLLTQAVASYSLATTRSRVLHDTRHAMYQITRELLQVGTGEITAIAPSQLSFLDQQNAATTYAINGSSVLRNQTLLLPNANTLTFTYFDSLGVQTNVIADVRRIGVELQVNAPTQGTFTLRSEVFPRSFIYTNFN
jgi:prepilin-type N-terminal cleavage/methylation domain-containing protein